MADNDEQEESQILPNTSWETEQVTQLQERKPMITSKNVRNMYFKNICPASKPPKQKHSTITQRLTKK